jgi:hypothetical protein
MSAVMRLLVYVSVNSAAFRVENEAVLIGGEILSDYTASRYKRLCYVSFEREYSTEINISLLLFVLV